MNWDCTRYCFKFHSLINYLVIIYQILICDGLSFIHSAGDPLTSSSESQRWPYIGRGSAAEGGTCRREGCNHFGRPERNGYCSQCFELFF